MPESGSDRLQATLDGDLLHPVTVIQMPTGPSRTRYLKTTPGRDIYKGADRDV